MLFNSIEFILFFPIVVLFYLIIPRKLRSFWLLIASYYFYMSWNPEYALLIGFSTLITYLSGLFIGLADRKKERRFLKNWIVAMCFLINIGILFFFKYFNFFIESLNRIFEDLGISVVESSFDIILPVGISFYTFQALSYTVDVYRREIEPEKNIINYALFVSFFPQLVAGPIERSKNLLKQIREVENMKIFSYEAITQGLMLMVWGFFQKMVISDRIAIVVNTVFDTPEIYGTFALLIGSFGFAIQIYCDFASYSLIAIGAAKVMGFELMENFNTPYFAVSIRDFWQRWHISLSTWFKDYLYIPMGGSRKGLVRKQINRMITFLISGLWHGASWNFVIWGGIHGFYQIIGDMTAPIKRAYNRKFNVPVDSISYKFGQMVITFLLVDFAWIFFRADDLQASVSYISGMFTRFDPWQIFSGQIFELGLERVEVNILFMSIVLLFLVDLIRYKKGQVISSFLKEQTLWFRWSVLLLLVLSIFVFGVYGVDFDSTQFIYFQF